MTTKEFYAEYDETEIKSLYEEHVSNFIDEHFIKEE